MRSLDGRTRRSWFADAIAHRIDRAFDGVRAAWHRRRGTPLPHNVRYRELERIHLRADSAYRPRPYHGPVTLFRATRDSPSATRSSG